MDNSVVIVGGGIIRVLNGNEKKNTIKVNTFKKIFLLFLHWLECPV